MSTVPPALGPADRRLVSLAVLRAHWSDGQSYIDTFLPFVLECVRLDGRHAVPLPDIKARIKEVFGIAMPVAAVETVLHRAGARTYGVLKRGCFEPTIEKLGEFDSRPARASVSREQNALIEAFQEHCSSQHQQLLSREEAEEALIGFVEEHASGILATAHGQPLSRREGGQELEYIVADFIAAVLEREPGLAAYLERLVVGSMLAAALFTPDLTNVERSFEGVDVFFDTPTLIDALGQAGDVPQKAQLESLRLVGSVGGRLCCFEHTVAEIEAVINYAADALRGGVRRATPAGSVEEYALREQLSADDLESAARQVRTRLARMGVSIIAEPAHEESLTINEAEAEELMKDAVKYPRTPSIRFDLDSLTATYRLRRGAFQYQLENCVAIFATPNLPLVPISRKVFPHRKNAIPVAISLADLVTLAWLKQPRVAPELPKLRIAADCFAAIRPSEALIARYSAEADKLQQRGEISEQDVHELRYDVESRAIMTRRTLGVVSNVTPETIHETLEERHEQIRREARAAAEQEARQARHDLKATQELTESETTKLQSQVEKLEAQTDRSRRREERQIHDRAMRGANWLTWPLFIFVFVVSWLVTIATVPVIDGIVPNSLQVSALIDSLPQWLFWPAAAIAVGVPAVVLTLNLGWGVSVKGMVAPVQSRVARHLEARYRRRSIFEHSDEPEADPVAKS
jgi:hypothetical protein